MKDAVVAANASPIFRLAPYIVFGAMCCAAAIVPSLATDLPFARAADAIALVGLFALARVFMALAAMDIGTAFGSLGARREMFVGFLAEPALLMVLFTASLISGSTSLPTIVDTLAHRELAIYPSLAFAGVAFTMVSLAENARIPIDNPATHLELTMIHEAMLLEYSARHLALIEWAAALKLFNYSCIGLALFFPFGIAPGGDWVGILNAAPILIAEARHRRGPAGADRDVLGQAADLPRARVPGHRLPAGGSRDARQPPARQLIHGERPALRAAHQPLRGAAPAAVVRDARATTRAVADRSLRDAGVGAGGVDRSGGLRDRTDAPLRIRRADAGAQGGPAAVAPVPADPAPRCALGIRGPHQHPDHDADRDRARRIRVQPRRADLAAREHRDTRRRWASRWRASCCRF